MSSHNCIASRYNPCSLYARICFISAVTLEYPILSFCKTTSYILGVSEAAETFTGKIVAIIHRYDDIEEKWVVCPENISFSKEEIMEQVQFQEQYYQSEIIM